MLKAKLGAPYTKFHAVIFEMSFQPKWSVRYDGHKPVFILSYTSFVFVHHI